MEIGTPIVKEVNGMICLYLKTELENGDESIDCFTIEQISKLIKRLKKIRIKEY